MLDLEALYGFHEELAGGVRSPRVNAALTYLAEIECYHPDDENLLNLIYQSENFAASPWDSPLVSPATVTSDSATDPNGGTTADTFTFITSGVSGRYQDVNVEPATQYTFSVYIKLGTSLGPDMYVSDMTNGGTIYGTGGLVGVSSSTWTRCQFTFTTPAGCRLIRVYPVWASGVGTVHVWGCMLNTGATAGTYSKNETVPTRTLRLSTLPYTSHIDDSPSQVHYESRLLQPGLLRRDLFSPGGPGGEIKAGYGIVEIINTGDLDDYTRASFDGRSYVLKVGRVDQPLRDFTTVLIATMESAEFTFDRLTIKLRDKLAELDNPITKKKYTAEGSALEGDADLKDRYKPLVFGFVDNVTPVLVSESLLIYQVSSRSVLGIDVFEGGLTVTPDSPGYTSAADMIANAPTAGHCKTWGEGGMFRLGFTPNMAITASVQSLAIGDETGSPGGCLKVMAEYGGWTGTINSADVAAVNSATDGSVGQFVENGGTALEAMNAIASGMGIWFGPDRLGELRMGVLENPTGTPVIYLNADDIVSIERQSAQSIPAKQVTLRYKKNWTRQTEFDASVTQSERQWRTQESLQVIAMNTANAISRKLAPVLEFDSRIVNPAAYGPIQTANRLMELYGAPRDTFNVTVRARPADTMLIDLNDIVEVTHPRFGMSAGKNFRVIGIESDYRIGKIELTLWG